MERWSKALDVLESGSNQTFCSHLTVDRREIQVIPTHMEVSTKERQWDTHMVSLRIVAARDGQPEEWGLGCVIVAASLLNGITGCRKGDVWEEYLELVMELHQVLKEMLRWSSS